MTPPLSGRVALVTGGATRLGREIALALAAAGADVGFSYHHSAEEASRTAADIAALGRATKALPCDIRELTQVEGMVAGVVAALGPIDLLVISSGVFRRTPLGEATEADWNWLMDTNAKGPFLCAQHVALQMRERGGAIIIIADVAGMRPWPNYVPYSASKAAAVSLTQGLALALAPKVRVNAIAPGPVLPPDGYGADETQRAIARTLLKREGNPRDITQAVLYLATADYVTGVVLPVDGGRHLA